jgi:Phospholipase A2
MTIPAFTAEASLYRTGTSYRQLRSAAPLDAADGGLLGLAQIGMPLLPIPAAPAPMPPMLLSGLDVYGKWCGPGNSGPGAPIDRVDQVCCRHDKCYSNRGYFDCSCDRDLIASMPAAIAHPSTSASGQVAGAGAIAVFTALPCICHRACFPFLGCHDIPGPGGVPGIPSGALKLCPPGFA